MKEDEIKQEFISNVTNEYENDKRITEDLGNLKYEKDTDGTYTQIAIRQLLNSDIFDPKVSIVRGILGLGHSIAVGEMNFFIKEIDSQIYTNQTHSFNFTDLNKLKDKINEYNDSFSKLVLLVSPRIEYHFLTKKLVSHHYDDGIIKEYLNGSGIQVVVSNSSILENTIILYEREKINIFYKRNKSTLFIDIIQRHSEYDVLTRSFMKIEVMQHQLIKLNIRNIPDKP